MSAIAEAARHARRMLDAEVALGHVVARIGIDRAGELARQIGVSRGRLVAAHQLATGAVRPHRPLERRVAGRNSGTTVKIRGRNGRLKNGKMSIRAEEY